MRKSRVIQWGTGATGRYALKYILESPSLELVGVKCYTPAKENEDAGVLCDHKRQGIKATEDTEALLDVDADCVVFMPRDPLADPSIEGGPSESWMQDLLAILASGKNVVSSICSGSHYRQLADGQAFLQRINEACAIGNSSVFFTGFDPGFASDSLVYSLSSVVGPISRIQSWEMLDYATYPVPEVLQALGFGVRPDEMAGEGMAAAIRTTYGGAPFLLGEAFGISIDDIHVDTDVAVSPRTFTSEGGLFVEAGTIGAVCFSVIGMVGGTPTFIVNHVNRIGMDMAPDWPCLGTKGGYRVEINAYPPFIGEFPLGQEEGTGAGFSDALAMTAARCVNSIEAVVAAKTGYRTFLDLKPLGGRYAQINN